MTPELEHIRQEIEGYARNYGLDFFDTIFEMIDYDQINSLAAYGGFPYPHWRFGMDYDQYSKGYTWGLQKIYEMVINTDPAYAYLMKANSLVDQKTVIAHVYAHVDFFKNNYWFSKTNRKMLDIMANHAVKMRKYMDRYGQEKVENFIDRCLTIETQIDPYLPFQTQKRPLKDEYDEETTKVPGKLKTQRQYMDSFINPPSFMAEQKKKLEEDEKKSKKNPPEPVNDFFTFLIDNAPLEEWEQEILAMVREEAYYFAPQVQTKIMNEGWATYWHSKIMTEKALKDSELIDFADHHAGTMAVRPGQLNPYKVGVELLRDIEDRWNRGKFGKSYDDCDDMVAKANWNSKLGLGRDKIFEVRKVCNDVTFIDEYLTEEFVERFQLYTFVFNRRTNQYEIADRDFRRVKEKLLFQLTHRGQPFIYIVDGNYLNKGELLLWHKHQGLDLDVVWAKETMKALSEIWKSFTLVCRFVKK
ncbi:MAG: SpoVR family protein [Deltaproteobacteria bacterium]|nr:SpoVR family protein [Deltaproteobacteria bacterium]